MQKRDLMLSLITLKYTQSNSVCYAKDGQAIGVGAGQQSRIHCTRLAGNKADIWHLRQHPEGARPAVHGRASAAPTATTPSTSTSPTNMRTCWPTASGQTPFTYRPEPLTRRREKSMAGHASRGVSLGIATRFSRLETTSSAPTRSGVQYIAEPGGSIRDDKVIETCDKYGIVMAFNGIRLFHH